MSDPGALRTVSLTVISGTLVVLFGQLANRFFLEPWYEQRKVIGAIAEWLLNYMHLFADSGTPHPLTDEASRRLGALASELVARTLAIPGYRVLSRLRLAPSRAEIMEASRGLIGLSNAVPTPNWQRKMISAKRVATSLKIEWIDPAFAQDWNEREG